MEDDIIDRLEQLFASQGAAAYLGEPVTVAEHMLQCAALAAAEGAPDALVVAALLHDIGHLTGSLGAYSPEDSVDRRHEEAGAEMLKGYFRTIVVESVRLHVAAKRYLCAVEPGYHERLTVASQHSLLLQGGPMDSAEILAFERLTHHRDATRVRLWDDGGKAPDTFTLPFRAYRPLIAAQLLPAAQG
jgi:phosphonate degradation associated HDIG domain protein